MFHRSVHAVKVGQSHRFTVEYSPFESQEHYATKPPQSLWVRVRNTEPLPLRAAYLAGPYVLYVDCRPSDFDTKSNVFVTADQPLFELQLLPGQAFYAELLCHTYKPQYKWDVDVVSQIIFNSSIAVSFEVCVASSRELFDSELAQNANLQVSNHDTLDLWNLPVPDTATPIHLVILTHGLHLNVSNDMLFLKEQLDQGAKDNVVVKGFFGNVCKTERGVKYLGSRVADYVVDLVTKNETFAGAKVSKISFIGHSLGGLVQTFAIAYLEANYPWFFQQVQPVNFITLASPMLGVIHENPAYVKLALLAGIVGRTGQDLGLYSDRGEPLLLLLPSGPTHRILRRFARRTVYANAVNDGIVPLRTSALLYLDYHGLSQLGESPEFLGNAAKIPHDLPSPGDDQTHPLLAMFSYFLPKQSRPYHKYQTNSENEGENTFELPKTSMLESASALILPPLPSMKYITNPDSRENVILHDKMYHEKDLPAYNKIERKAVSRNGPAQGVIQMIHGKGEELRKLVQGNEALEEEIAREYHKLMLWRKVLLKLKPDAHNNIVVRRRFANAYGWPVIDHLVKNHFAVDDNDVAELTTEDSLDVADEALKRILSKDAIHKENEDIEKSASIESCEHSWINAEDEESFFAVGPTGLLLDFSDMVWKFKDQWGTRPDEIPKAKSEEPVDAELPLNKRVMGGYM